MLKKLNLAIGVSALSLIIFFIIKSLVLLEIIDSTRETRAAEFTLLLIFAPFYIKSVRDLVTKKTEKLSNEMSEMEDFINTSNIISKADSKGKITYVNDKFIKISGYSLEEVLGKNHNIVNSGHHSKDFWKGMYVQTIKEKKIWNGVVTNKSKDGDLYYVDTYIKANFDDDKLKGFTSIRQDVTELKLKEVEIRNRMNAINRSNCVVEFDLDGKIMFANDLFLTTMGYHSLDGGGLDEVVNKHHSIFIDEEYKNSEEYIDFWNKLKSGECISGEFKRKKKDGEDIWLQASYNPIINSNGDVYKIMKIAQDITDMVEQRREIDNKNTYLEHAAKILRHDMHSGINTYIPRGISSLERRLTEDDIKNLKIEAPLRMIKEGLKHAQKVYKGVYEFTNLVKKDVCLTKTECNIKSILDDYLSSTSYKSQVLLDDNLPTIMVNESLFCTSIDNLIRNGLKYNDSGSKMVKVYTESINGVDYIIVEDNGRGIDQNDFDHLSKPYVRKEGQKESGTGLGLNICKAILHEHGFEINAEKLEKGGTKLKIKYA
jgi:PAS domain S-box-containing protein